MPGSSQGAAIIGKIGVATALLTMLAGCAVPSEPLPAERCLLPRQQRMIVSELFFGRAIRGRAPLTASEWALFAAQAITPNFPGGFTVFDGEGQWCNPRTGEITHEPTKILLVAETAAPGLARRLAAVIEAYEQQFHQQSVGIITTEACAAF
jgi:hypothetical protein